MTREDIASFQFKSPSAQSDWDSKAPLCYDELMSWIKKAKNEKWENNVPSMKNWQMNASHALARLSDIQTEAQGWFDIADSEHAIQQLQDLSEKKMDGKSMYLKALRGSAVLAPMFILSASINFRESIERGLTAVQSNLKSEKWQPT